MDEGGSHPCLDLGGGPEHRLLAWAGRHTGRKGLVSITKGEALRHLEDAGYVERDEESHRYRVLAPCTCEAGGNPPTPEAALRWESSLRLDDPNHFHVNGGGSVVASGEMERSAKKPAMTTVSLAKYFFPQVMRAAGIAAPTTNVYALAHHLNKWKTWGIDLSTIKLMMEEFGRHPEWSRRSPKPPWRVFVAKQEELFSAVAYQKRKDPANRQWSTGKKWFRHTLPVNSPA